jgi:hypothetical protein
MNSIALYISQSEAQLEFRHHKIDNIIILGLNSIVTHLLSSPTKTVESN